MQVLALSFNQEDEMLLRIREVERVTGLNRSTIRRLEQQGRFPLRRTLGNNAVGWLAEEVEDWIRSRPVKDKVAARD